MMRTSGRKVQRLERENEEKYSWKKEGIKTSSKCQHQCSRLDIRKAGRSVWWQNYLFLGGNHQSR
jgi:hypothetical protein